LPPPFVCVWACVCVCLLSCHSGVMHAGLHLEAMVPHCRSCCGERDQVHTAGLHVFFVHMLVYGQISLAHAHVWSN
jgi:hypothetical protein